MKGNELVEKIFTKDEWSIYRWKTRTSQAYAKHNCQKPNTVSAFDNSYCWKCGAQAPDDINALLVLFNYGLSTQRRR